MCFPDLRPMHRLILLRGIIMKYSKLGVCLLALMFVVACSDNSNGGDPAPTETAPVESITEPLPEGAEPAGEMVIEEEDITNAPVVEDNATMPEEPAVQVSENTGTGK